MAKSYEELKNDISAITNEVEDGANTANRIGGAMDDIVDYTKDSLEAQEERINEETDIKISGLVVQETGDGEGVAMSQKAVTKKLSEFKSGIDENTKVILESRDATLRDYIGIWGGKNDLFVVTKEGGYINGSGVETSNTRYNSCLLNLENGYSYAVLNQHIKKANPNNVRVFLYENDIYTQVTVIKDILTVYTCPNNGTYYLQVIEDTLEPETVPSIFKVESNSLLKDVLELKNTTKKEIKKEIKMLSIGNSYSRDAFSYLPFIIESIIDCDVTLGILYLGDGTLENHYNLISNKLNYSAFDFYTTKNGVWQSEPSKDIDYAISMSDWDIITLQQQSSNSRYYETFQPYLNDIINLLYNKLGNNVKIGWVLTPSYPNGYSGLGQDTSDSMYEKICNAVERVMSETAIEFFFPCGTAKQNATTTSLNSLGNFGGMFYEGLHLQEGIPCLIEAYVAALTILNLIGFGHKGIYGNEIRPTQEWLTNKNIPQRHGESVGVTDDNCRIAQLCAMVAHKNPLQITQMSQIVE